MVDAGGWAVLGAATVAGSVTIAGYLLSQSWSRRERKARMYADAIAAMRRFQELPYKILRRAASDSATRATIGQEHSDSISGVAYHQALLRIDSAVVGEADLELFDQVRRAQKINRVIAWRTTVLCSDPEMADNPPFVRSGSDIELSNCILAMRRELRVTGPLHRASTRRRITRQRQVRTAARADVEANDSGSTS